MKSGHRRYSLRCQVARSYLFWLALLVSIIRAGPTEASNIPSLEWTKILKLKNEHEGDACALERWMDSPMCLAGGGTGGDGHTSFDFLSRGDFKFTPTACTCALPFFNIVCACRLSRGNEIETVYNTWHTECEQQNFSTQGNTDWMKKLPSDIPGWAYISHKNRSFALVARETASTSGDWGPVQIIVPIVVGLSIVILAGVIFLYWRRSHLQESEDGVNTPFLADIRRLFPARNQTVRRGVRSGTWVIDGNRERQHIVNKNDDDTEEPPVLQPSATFVESPAIERSHWSPTTTVNSPANTRANTYLSFTAPRHPVEQGVLGTSTMRDFRNRVKRLLPWTTRPVPVNRVPPSRHFNIDAENRNTRTNTLSSLSTKQRGRYEAISERDEEEPDMVPTGRTRYGGRYGHDARSVITDEDRDAVASVVIIGNPSNTVESGSSGHNHPIPAPQRGRPFRGASVNVRSPSITVDFLVEPPSPTLESIQVQSIPKIPVSPGAPPLLPPAPQAQPPNPPLPTQSTSRRTPSPRLRISTQFDDNAINLPSHNHSNPALQASLASEPSHPTPRTSPSKPQHSLGHHRDLLGSGGSAPGTNVLSYDTISGISHRHSQSLSDPHNNNNGSLSLGARSSLESRRRSGSGSRPLPPQPPEPSRPVPVPPWAHQASDTSIDQFSILRTPDAAITQRRRLSANGEMIQSVTHQNESEFDPYLASGIPRPLLFQSNRRPDDTQHSYPYTHHQQRPSSSSSLPRAPGDSVGHLQRGWSVDDDADRVSLLMDRPPMAVDDGMSGSRGVYIATPRDVTTLGVKSLHYRSTSSDTFATAMSDSGLGESSRNSHRFSSGAIDGDISPTSPTLSMLQSDARNNTGFASYAGRASISGSSGWDANTIGAHKTDSPIEPPPLPTVGRSPKFSPHPLANFSPNLSANRALSPHPSPRLGHARLGSETSSLQHSRSREEILNPAKNDPVRLFPASVRAAGYTIGLTPDSVPSPARTPRPSGDVGGGSTSTDNPGNGYVQGSSTSSARAIAGTGELPGYVERDRTQVSGGGTWGTDSSGIQSVFEPVQQLPDAYPLHAASSGNKRTP